jgi:hypothetical protein
MVCRMAFCKMTCKSKTVDPFSRGLFQSSCFFFFSPSGYLSGNGQTLSIRFYSSGLGSFASVTGVKSLKK